jgi:alkyl hydroperoxide reductase subunit AhpF
MLDATLKAQLKAYLEKLQHPIEIVASLDDSSAAQANCLACCPTSPNCRSDKITVSEEQERRPQAVVRDQPQGRQHVAALRRPADGP